MKEENNERKRKEESCDTELEKTNIFMFSWWGKDDTRDPREGRDRGAKMITIIKEKNKHH